MNRDSFSILPLVAATYAARSAEETIHHLRGNLKSDDDIHEFVATLMEEVPSRALAMRPPFDVPQPNLIALQETEAQNPDANEQHGTQACLFYHVQKAYNNVKKAEHEGYLQHIHRRLDRGPSVPAVGEVVQDTDLLIAEGWLQDYLGVAESYLSLKLANRT